MKVRLLFPDRDFDLALGPPPGSDILAQDLGLEALFRSMAGGDRFLAEVVQKVVLASLDDPGEISYRQDILDDCLAHPEAVRELYAIAGQAIERQRSVWGWSTRFADTLVQRSVEILTLLLEAMRRVRAIAETSAPATRSDGLRRLFAELETELDDAFLEQAEMHLRRLRRRDEVVLTAALGPGTRGGDYVLRRRVHPRTWRERLGLGEPESYSYQVAPRDDAGSQMLGNIRKRGLALAADATARSSDHVVSFFTQLRSELAFYVGCLNLRDELRRLGGTVCRPEALPVTDRSFATRGLYDVSLSLAQRGAAVANDLESPDVRLVVVTGANRGGKSTFLRSLGLAQVMLQSGMFVGAEAFAAPVRHRIFTHFRREEDPSLTSGKLDEELERMRWIVDHTNPRSLVLLNESFASTNEREGSEIGRQVISALLDAGVTVVLVTHLSSSPTGSSPTRGQTPASCARSVSPMAGGRSAWSTASRCPRATARISTSGSSRTGRAMPPHRPAAPRCAADQACRNYSATLYYGHESLPATRRDRCQPARAGHVRRCCRGGRAARTPRPDG